MLTGVGAGVRGWRPGVTRRRAGSRGVERGSRGACGGWVRRWRYGVIPICQIGSRGDATLGRRDRCVRVAGVAVQLCRRQLFRTWIEATTGEQQAAEDGAPGQPRRSLFPEKAHAGVECTTLAPRRSSMRTSERSGALDGPARTSRLATGRAERVPSLPRPGTYGGDLPPD
jgi:hypothetical protein